MNFYTHMPNISMLMRDDWIEIVAVCIYSGSHMKYTIYPNGFTLRETLDEDHNLTQSEFCQDKSVSMSTYAALSEIADLVTANLQALEDFN